MEIKWIFEISFVLVSTVLFSLENKNCFVHGVHLNKKIQNLSIESSGKLLASNSGVESPPEKSSPSGPDLNNSESLSANTNNSEIAPNSTDSLDDNDNHTNNKYIEYNGKLDFENVILKNGIAYDGKF
ncbi:hypothetical protein FG386_002881 [Cryptosporidium ryanae]|uniref:uncharacterized protein n=1 Tax=Cryptosporidium ryanae TaxID=515981 RepID=UPI00351AAF09|nr:hypothetical protein FG386_002881 [Cryptosporidium ryanae]